MAFCSISLAIPVIRHCLAECCLGVRAIGGDGNCHFSPCIVMKCFQGQKYKSAQYSPNSGLTVRFMTG